MKYFNRLKVATRLSISYAIIMILFFSIGFRVMHSYVRTARDYNDEIHYTVAVLDLVESIRDEYVELRTMANRYLMNMGDSAFLDTQITEVNQRINSIQGHASQLEILVVQQDRMTEKGMYLQQIHQTIPYYQNMNLALIEIARVGDVQAYGQVLADFLTHPAQDNMLYAIEGLMSATQQQLLATSEYFSSLAALDLILAIVSLVSISAFCIGITIIITRSIAKPLSNIETCLLEMQNGNFAKMEGDYGGEFNTVKSAVNTTADTTLSYIEEIAVILSAISKGDLTVNISREYIGSYAPIKDALHIILNSLNATMSEIINATEQVVSGSEQISQSAMHLREGAAKQTHALDELSEAVSTIHSKAEQASTNANDANKWANNSEESAQVGGIAVQALTANMLKIKESSESISQVFKIVDDIAFQTNLLALNASVEAARAAEYGKGFAVVAEEVRTLAGRSKESVSETTTIVKEDIESVERGLKATNEVVSSFEAISGDIGKISEIVSQIANLSSEQLIFISSVHDSVSEVSGVATNNSSIAQESAASSEELNAQAEMLRKMVSFFKLRK